MPTTTAPPDDDQVTIARVAKATRLAVVARSGGLTAADMAHAEKRRAVLQFAPRTGRMHRHVADADLAAATWPGASEETWALVVTIMTAIEDLG